MKPATGPGDSFRKFLEDERRKWKEEGNPSKAFDKISQTFSNIMFISQLAEKETREKLNDIHDSDEWHMETGKPLPMFDDTVFMEAIKTVLADDFETSNNNLILLEHYFTALLTFYGNLFIQEETTPVPFGTLMKAQAESMELSFSMGFIAGQFQGGRSKLTATQKTKRTTQRKASDNKRAILKIYEALLKDGELNEKDTMEERYNLIKEYIEKNNHHGVTNHSRSTIMRSLQKNK